MRNITFKRIDVPYRDLLSEEHGGFIAIVPELAGCSAFGKTEEKALQEVKIAMKLWLETAKEIGRSIRFELAI